MCHLTLVQVSVVFIESNCLSFIIISIFLAWTSITSTGTQNWNGIAISSSGKYQSASATSSAIFASYDFGSSMYEFLVLMLVTNLNTFIFSLGSCFS